MFTVGVHRWSLILTGRAGIHQFPADSLAGPDWYRRAVRAHANCVENLPVFASIVGVATAAGVKSAALDALALAVVGSRVGQTVTHVAFPQTRRVVSVRFSFFCVQLAAMLAMAAIVAKDSPCTYPGTSKSSASTSCTG
jgi:uncharacterized MAPEG superfamily protein